MNQGKLEVVKQEIVRVNVGILGISELKWTGMGEFTQMTIISTTAGRNPSEEKEYVKAVYCYPAYLTDTQSTS